MKEKIIVVGNGITSISAIKAIREFDKDSEIKLFGDEKFYPYNRIRLSKGLLGTLEEDKLLLQKKDWYKENNINLLIDTKVSLIDTEKREVEVSSGERFSYTKLLLANGASNFTPNINGINKSGVFTLRTLQDAKNIVEAAGGSNNVLCIGGGILGLELAWVLSQAGKKVTITELAQRLMPSQLDLRASEILEKAVKANGIEIMLNSQVSEISVREDGVEGVITNEGKFLNCDMVTYSIGVRPNTDIVKQTNIKINKGIVVNEKMETSVQDIYAAGDIAEVDGRVYGLWNIAIGQGMTAGYNIVGKETRYKYVAPVITMSAFGISLFSMGIIDENENTDVLVEDKEDNNYRKIFIKDNKIIGAIVIGDTKISPILKRAIENEVNIGGIDYKNVYIDEIIETIKNSK